MKSHHRNLVLAVLVLAGQAFSQVPHIMSYQGILTDASGTPVPDGPVNLTFRLFDAPAGGTAVWEESQQVAVSKGVFNALLGSTTPLDLPFDKPYWLSVMVGQGLELTPRAPLSASPYSMNSRTTMAEPGNGQGITVRDLAGVATHVLHQDGDTYHAGKMLLGAGLQVSLQQPDTALMVGVADTPALLFVLRPSGQGGGGVHANELIGRDLENSSSIQQESKVGDLLVLGGDLSVIDGVTQEPNSVVGLDGILTKGTLAVVGGHGDTVVVFRPDGSSYHRGLEVFESGLSITGVGKGIRFPDGSFQGSAGSPAPPFDGILTGKALVVKNSSGVEVFRVDTTGTSLHKGDETFEGDVILKGQDGKGAKLVDGTGETIAGFGRVDLETGQRIGVYGKASGPGDLAGAFEGDVEVIGEVYASSLHIVRAPGDTVVQFNADGTSHHKGLETYQAGLQTVLSNGNTLRMNPAEGLTLKTAGGQFRGHMDPNGNGLFAGNVGIAGNLNVGGTLSKASGSFKIDHPLDPANKYLYHSFVESPDMMNIYNGNAILDGAGEAVVELPAWFEALNKDFRYQLTAIGAPGPNLHVAEKIRGNHFRLAGGTPGMEISWQVTGIRKDAYAEKNRIPVEEPKPMAERGHYLYPEAFEHSRKNGKHHNETFQETGSIIHQPSFTEKP